MQRPRTMLFAAIALLFVGVLGLAATGVAVTLLSGGASSRLGGFSSNGERIFFTGVGRGGRIANEWDPAGSRFGPMMRGRGRSGMARMGCASCHGPDGRGRFLGMMSGLSTPDIRYSALTSEPDDGDGGTSQPWGDQDIENAVRDGIEPDGEKLDPIMPRWDMDDTDMADTIDYLKELD